MIEMMFLNRNRIVIWGHFLCKHFLKFSIIFSWNARAILIFHFFLNEWSYVFLKVENCSRSMDSCSMFKSRVWALFQGGRLSRYVRGVIKKFLLKAVHAHIFYNGILNNKCFLKNANWNHDIRRNLFFEYLFIPS